MRTVSRWTMVATGTLAAAVAAGCGRAGMAPSAADRALAARITGVWDAEFLLDESPFRAPAHLPPAERARVRGALTLLATTRTDRTAEEWLDRPVTLTGVYDLNVDHLGFSLPHGSDVATLVAATAAPDSVVAVLPAGGSDHVLVLRGTVTGDVIRGTWSYAGRAIPAWRGTCQLRRRTPPGAR